jgi:NADH:flavin oxidoreductase / NADH oxidase family
MTTTSTTTTVLAEPLTLPCGLVLPNRILKGALGEGLANPWTADVTPALIRLYERWADGGTGTLITGVICVQRGAEDNVIVALDDKTDTDALRRWASAVPRRDVRLLGQIQHPGRQAPVYMARHPVAPSVLPPVRGSRLFGSSRALIGDEITDLIEKFATAAVMLERAGFDGVELHAAHGYLIGQFLSPETNRRTDDWGGDLDHRARFLIGSSGPCAAESTPASPSPWRSTPATSVPAGSTSTTPPTSSACSAPKVWTWSRSPVAPTNPTPAASASSPAHPEHRKRPTSPAWPHGYAP